MDSNHQSRAAIATVCALEFRGKIGRFGTCLVLGSETIAGVSCILAYAQLAASRQARTGDVAVRRGDGRGRLAHGNVQLRRTLLPEYPDITLYIEHLRSRIWNEPLEEVRFASPFFLRSVDVPIGVTKGKQVVELRRLGKRIVFALALRLPIRCSGAAARPRVRVSA